MIYICNEFILTVKEHQRRKTTNEHILITLNCKLMLNSVSPQIPHFYHKFTGVAETGLLTGKQCQRLWADSTQETQRGQVCLNACAVLKFGLANSARVTACLGCR